MIPPWLSPDPPASTRTPRTPRSRCCAWRCATTTGRGLRAVFADADAATATHLVEAAAQWGGLDSFLRLRLRDEPQDQLAQTLLGATHLRIGWRIRTGAMADQVSADRFARFHDHLRRAEQLLIDVTARWPDDVAARTQRITTARGLQLGQAETRRRYDRLARHRPHHLPAQLGLLQQLCPKWGGDWAEVDAFARSCVEATPPGAPHGVLVAQAHIERIIEYADRRAFRVYLRSPDVAQEIQAAADRSVRHPDFQHTIGWVSVRSTFALVFHVMGEHTAAREQFDALGPHGDPFFFGYLGHPADRFVQARDEAYAKGRAR
ncbi:hypothetical protein [Micromonospora sp. NPDC093277]|uniref:hypothetical protein n=1 Tax=Micromonospora sp. NPDC093277 TaxID=3364291 RepID=UPI0037F5395E